MLGQKPSKFTLPKVRWTIGGNELFDNKQFVKVERSDETSFSDISIRIGVKPNEIQKFKQKLLNVKNIEIFKFNELGLITEEWHIVIEKINKIISHIPISEIDFEYPFLILNIKTLTITIKYNLKNKLLFM